MRNTMGVMLIAVIGLATVAASIPDPGSIFGAGDDQAAPAVTRYQGPTATLPERWSWAGSEAKRQGFSKGYWVGYSIEKMMGERSFIGNFYSDERKNRPSLGELVTGILVNDLPPYPEGEFGSMSGFVTYDDEDEKPNKKIKKEVGILLHIGADRSIDEVDVSNFSLHVDLDGDPLLWLGPAGYDESVGFLESRYDAASTTDAKKRFMVAVGIHDESQKAIDFLKGVLKGTGDTDLRGDAAFWLGQTDNDAARKVLNDVAWKDESEDVREKCIFALSQMNSDAAIDDIIALAKGHKDVETRKQATFWLGQKASEKAVGTLKDLAYNDADTEIQKSAVFALTQGDGKHSGVDELIQIARDHPNPKIRKSAIFWLGQTEDPRAVEELVKLVKGN